MWDVKYRPTTFAEVIGQEGTVKVLKSRLVKGTALDTSYIFSGGHGRGKTTLARILGRALLCQDLRGDGEPCNECDNCEAILGETSMAFSELDAASRGTIDNVRRIVDDLDFVTPGAAKRIYVFDESHRMSRDAQDVLLKPLEDKRLVGIFCTTEPAKIRGTIRSRCEEYPIRKITRESILARMRTVLEQEGVSFEEDAVLTVIDHCGGHVRDVLNRLEMISQMGSVTLNVVREYLELGLVEVFYKVLLSLGRPAEAVDLVEEACERIGVEDVSAGIAEAAMGSYRLAHGMFAEFTYIDRGLAEKVYQMYGDDVIRLAEYFLRRRVGKTGLLCDVIRCAGGVPDPESSATSSPPVQVHTRGSELAQHALSKAQPSSDPSPSPEAVKTIEEPKEVSPSPPVSVPEQAPSTDSLKSASKAVDLREDGIGNLGSSDINALTSVDMNGIAVQLPRGWSGGNAKKNMPFKGTKGSKFEMLLTPDEWAREFAATWRGISG